MSHVTTRSQRRQMARENAKQPKALCEIPRSEWPASASDQRRVLRSRDFLVQEYSATAPAVARLSICRTTLSGGEWADGITWDELQRIKRECGYGDSDAIEIYPSDFDVVNVANMRHLWIMGAPVACAWRRSAINLPKGAEGANEMLLDRLKKAEAERDARDLDLKTALRRIVVLERNLKDAEEAGKRLAKQLVSVERGDLLARPVPAESTPVEPLIAPAANESVNQRLLEAPRGLLVRVADDEEYGPDHAVTIARGAIESAVLQANGLSGEVRS